MHEGAGRGSAANWGGGVKKKKFSGPKGPPRSSRIKGKKAKKSAKKEEIPAKKAKKSAKQRRKRGDSLQPHLHQPP